MREFTVGERGVTWTQVDPNRTPGLSAREELAEEKNDDAANTMGTSKIAMKIKSRKKQW